MEKLKLGKLPATYDKRDLMFARYRTAEALPSHPKYFGHEKLVGQDAWKMLGNGPDDSVAPNFEGASDCVFAGGDHETMLWTLEGKTPATFVGKNAIADYSAVTGYNIKAPLVHGVNPTDKGTQTRDGLKYRQKTGLIDDKGHRHKIGAYVSVELGNLDQLLEALYLFGVVGIGIQFPDSAMDQFNENKPWSVVSGPPPTEGHYIPLVANRNNLLCVTWGRIQQMTVAFYKKYCDEAWAILSPEMLVKGKSLEGFNLAELQKDLANI
ncbi:MAG TPA: hypothetical protein VK743_22510 [Steroidobacteraceae bacterium]|jgi:hypothetical protein|nr:hypothetical protein [Steroidobacteraceae bacterium]